MKRRKNIALFIGILDAEFTRDICEGAMLAAEEIDANLFVLPGGILDADYGDETVNTFRHQYNILYSYAALDSFDAVVLEYGAITSFLSEERKKEFLNQLKNVPTILLAGNEEGFSSVSIDNKHGIDEAVSHLIEEHNCTQIGFVSGPKTNQDADERLQAYLETMRKYNLDVPEQRILYNDFTEFHADLIEAFILQNPGMEAIVFANDQMAVSGYKAAENLGLKPGTDILITGFDDSPFAMMLEPHMTSVKVEPKELSYRAVLECPKVIKGQEVHESVKARLIVRESCGCSERDIVQSSVDRMLQEQKEELIRNLTDDLFTKYFNTFFNEKKETQIREIVKTYFNYYFSIIQPDGTLKLDKKEFRREYFKYMKICQAGYVDLKQFLLVDQILYVYMSRLLEDDKLRLEFMELLDSLRMELISSVTSRMLTSIEKSKLYELVLANITSDMICYVTEEQKGYESLMIKLQQLEFPSSCILGYKDTIAMPQDGKWILLEQLYGKARHDTDSIHIYQGDESVIGVSDIFNTQSTLTDERFDILVLPLFAGADQYGLMMIESNAERFQYAIQIACQVGLALDVIELSKQQIAIKKELEYNLAKTLENNKMLDEISRLDPLTGILNRRGFLDAVKKSVANRGNYGKKAVAVYADMNNLKIVNDEFGHDEGDYALGLIAKALSESFRHSDVVARMGGDEFAAFAISDLDNFSQTIKERIRSTLAKYNEDNGKPYYVNVSVGTAEFVIGESTNIDRVLTIADKDLYIDKKKKSKIIYKENKGSNL